MKSEYDLETEARINREEMARAVARARRATLAERPKERISRRRLVAALVVGVVVALVLVVTLVWKIPVARAATTISVTSTADILANDGQCTLREAIIAANTDKVSGALPGECPAGAGADTIVLQSGAIYTLALRSIDALDPNPAEGDLDITADLAIVVADGGTATIDGNGATILDRVLDITDASVSLTGVTVRGGNAVQGMGGADGGGIRTQGTGDLTLTNSAVSANNASAATGGGISFVSSGTLTITRSVVSGNSALAVGGIAGAGGPVKITASTIADNTGTQVVGAIYIQSGALIMVDSTSSGNRSPIIPGIATGSTGPHAIIGSTLTGNIGGGGGSGTITNSGGNGLFNVGTLKVSNSTISGNSGPANQPGIAIDNIGGTLTLVNVTIADNTSGIRQSAGTESTGTITVRNSIIANSVSGPNCVGAITELFGAGYNLDSGISCGFAPGNHSFSNTDPQLNPLGNYGGPTRTQSPQAGSPTRDQIPVVSCPVPLPPAVGSIDQRGVARPQGATCDIGAVENGPAPTITDASPASGKTSGGTTLQIHGTNFLDSTTVSVGGLPCAVTSGATTTALACTTPPHTDGVVDVVVTNHDGQGATLKGGFTYYAGAVTVTASGPGAVNPGSGNYSGTVAFTATPLPGNLFLGWTVDGTFVGLANLLDLPVTDDRTIAAAFAPRPGFTDVPGDLPGEDAIAHLTAHGIIHGYGDGTFGPNDPVLRAQMAALIARTMGWDGEDHGNTFPDQGSVDADLWRNVGTLAFYGVARGFPDGTYDPSGNVLQAQVISFITRAMVARGYWVQQPEDPALYPNVPVDSGHRADIATYVHYAGALPDYADVHAAFGGWDQAATRAWFARALWQAYGSYFATNHLP